MIDPQVEIVDFDAGWLARVMQRRPRPEWLWVLDRPGAPASDPEALLASSGRERVVVLAADRTSELAAQVAAAAGPELTQLDYVALAHAIFWSSPAVRTAPAPPPAPSLPAWERLARRCEGGVAVLEAGDLVLAGRFVAGRLTWLSSIPPAEPPALQLRCTAEALEAALLAPDPWAAASELLDQLISKS